MSHRRTPATSCAAAATTWSASRPRAWSSTPCSVNRCRANIRMLSNSRNRVVTAIRSTTTSEESTNRCSARSACPRSRPTSAPTAAANSHAEWPGEDAETVEQGGGIGGHQPVRPGNRVRQTAMARMPAETRPGQHIQPRLPGSRRSRPVASSWFARPPTPAPVARRPADDTTVRRRPTGHRLSACRRRERGPGTAERRRCRCRTCRAGARRAGRGPPTTHPAGPAVTCWWPAPAGPRTRPAGRRWHQRRPTSHARSCPPRRAPAARTVS